jgi:serine/threonine protein kinase
VLVIFKMCRALDYAFQNGVIHRDIKPANLILTEAGTLKVADFGIARIDTSSLTSLGMVMGTPSYMSPEQCQGQVVDRRSDLFSAAVVFYELVAGEKPFSGALETIAYKICHEDPRPASTVSRTNRGGTGRRMVNRLIPKPGARGALGLLVALAPRPPSSVARCCHWSRSCYRRSPRGSG